MSRRNAPGSARLVVSAIHRDDRRLHEAYSMMEEALGSARFVGPLFPFDCTEYYSDEMGSPLFRRFIEALSPVSRESLPDIKIEMERIERSLTVEERRTVNLDPGLVTPENFILATGKNFSHRVYLRDGVFADLTLVYRKGEYRALPWTYPDYASAEIRGLLKGIRSEILAGGETGRARRCG